jgi:hypothetical protein
MRNNCGILAFDKAVGMLNGKTSRVSMDTLAKMAQDNGFLLYPMKIPVEAIPRLSFPYIVGMNNHFEAWSSENVLSMDDFPEDSVYVLSAELFPEFIITEDEAKLVKGSKKSPQMSVPSQVTSLQNQLNNGGTTTPVGAEAASTIQTQLNTPFGQLYPQGNANNYLHSTLSDMDTEYAKDLKNINNYYANYGITGSAEHEQALSDFQQQAAAAKASTVNTFNMNQQQQEITTRNSDLSQALGLDEATTAQLAQLAGLDTDVAAQNLGAKEATRTADYGLVGSIVGAVGKLAGSAYGVQSLNSLGSGSSGSSGS